MPTRILVADDNPAVRAALRHLLEGAGYRDIIEVENGQQAIAKARELKPNLIILDLIMPVMDGLAAARELSKLLPDIPLLMHTLHWSKQMEIEAQKVGVRKVVPKAERNGLIAAVQQFLLPEPAPVAAVSESIPANLPPPEITALPPIADHSGSVPAAPGEAETPEPAGPDDIKQSSPPV
jgi:two-component system, chemotaxis family, chemotaxis protein CheY